MALWSAPYALYCWPNVSPYRHAYILADRVRERLSCNNINGFITLAFRQRTLRQIMIARVQWVNITGGSCSYTAAGLDLRHFKCLIRGQLDSYATQEIDLFSAVNRWEFVASQWIVNARALSLSVIMDEQRATHSCSTLVAIFGSIVRFIASCIVAFGLIDAWWCIYYLTAVWYWSIGWILGQDINFYDCVKSTYSASGEFVASWAVNVGC